MENKWSLADVLSEDKYYLANSKALELCSAPSSKLIAVHCCQRAPPHQQVPGTDSTAPSDADLVLGKMLTRYVYSGNEQGGECPTP